MSRIFRSRKGKEPHKFRHNRRPLKKKKRGRKKKDHKPMSQSWGRKGDDLITVSLLRGEKEGKSMRFGGKRAAGKRGKRAEIGAI